MTGGSPGVLSITCDAVAGPTLKAPGVFKSLLKAPCGKVHRGSAGMHRGPPGIRQGDSNISKKIAGPVIGGALGTPGGFRHQQPIFCRCVFGVVVKALD